MSAAVELRPTIDRQWLEAAAAREPLAHAFAVWDLDRSPESVRFASAIREGETVGYLLVWLGRRDRPIVHWFGPADLGSAFAPSLPPPPFVAVVPPDAERGLLVKFPAARSSGLRLMLRESAGSLDSEPTVRRLTLDDRPALDELLRRESDEELAGYAGLPLDAEPTWGAFEVDRLVGVARAAVRLPRVWVVSGVYVRPSSRRRGHGRALVAAVIAEAERSGARAGLYVRDAPSPALRLYEAIGFREVGRRRWLEVGRPRTA